MGNGIKLSEGVAEKSKTFREGSIKKILDLSFRDEQIFTWFTIRGRGFREKK